MRDDSSTSGPRAPGRLPRIATAGAIALVTVSATAACAAAGAQPAAAPAATAPSTAAPPTSPTAQNASHGGTLIASAWVTPHAVLNAVPAGATLTPLETASTSRDGRTLYLDVQIRGGKCGTYDVVLEPSDAGMRAGVIHVITKGQACSTQETNVTITVGTAAPVGMHPVVDLATGKPLVAIAVN
jgi:hypothetical protein